MGRKILVIGAGRSSSTLIKYLLDNAQAEDWDVKVGDMDTNLAESKVKGHARGEVFSFDALNDQLRAEKVKESDIVISMLPASFHTSVAKDCLHHGKSVITPSYVSDAILNMDEDARNAGIMILNEMGLDPGIDHMSAMAVFDRVRESGGTMTRFESFTGGLVAPESDNNPWNYKLTWNPRNVVLAGQGGAARFIQNGRYKYIPYHRLFERVKPIEIDGYGKFEGYANRDSLSYITHYGLSGIPTIYRGTLRRAGYSEAWNVLVQLGLTDDTFVVSDSDLMTYREFVNSFLFYDEQMSVEVKIRKYLNMSDEVFEKLKWLGLFSDEPVGLKNASPAQILQKLMESKMSLDPDDKDMIVMWHRFDYTLNGKEHEMSSSMVVKGEDLEHTAMSKTVGLPVGIACKMMLQGTLDTPGVHLPLRSPIYAPILKELEDFGIRFVEKDL